MKQYKKILIICLLLSSKPMLAGAAVKNSGGQATVDPMYDSDDAALAINGAAAEQLFNLLQGTGSVKSGPNISCKSRVGYGGAAPSVVYECLMRVNSSGEVKAWNEEL